jgi:hypothetical protein
MYLLQKQAGCTNVTPETASGKVLLKNEQTYSVFFIIIEINLSKQKLKI